MLKESNNSSSSLCNEAVAFWGMIIVVLFLMLQEASFTDVLPIVALYAFAGYRLMPALQSIYADI